MSLDILTYRKDGEIIKIFDFDEELHQIIFWNDLLNWDKNSLSYSIKDYYKANATYEGTDCQSFIRELANIRSFIPIDKQYKLDHLLNSLSSDEIYKIKIIGD